MQGYIYLNFSDLSEEKQEHLKDLAREEIEAEEDFEEWAEDRQDFSRESNLDKYKEFIEESIDNKLLTWASRGLFAFNI